MKVLFILLVLCTGNLMAQNRADIIIRNGKIIDGTGNPWYYGDVAIRAHTIVATGNLNTWSADNIIDATGLIIAPGFIDVHTHIEDDEVKNPTANNFIRDGVTTVITGNCGSSHVNTGAYLAFIDSLRLSVNTATFIGHNDVREAVMGKANRPPTSQELDKMIALVNKAMQEGAVGFSTGLIYTPGSYASTDEIIALAKVAAAYNGVYATHMRNESDSVTYAIHEALRIAKAAGIPLQISHFKIGGQQNWGRSRQTIEMVKKARTDGLDVTIDQYPYTASSTALNTLLPDWILAGNDSVVKQRLRQPAVVKEATGYMLKKLAARKMHHFSYAVVAFYKADTTLNGKSIEAINLLWKRKHTAAAEATTIIDMVIGGGASMVFHGMSEDDVKCIMQYPFNMPASDASIRVMNEGAPHPRGYGTNARILGRYVREQKIITLEEAIRRMTSLPAQKFHLTDRGLLRPGFAADIVLFDADAVTDLSTFQQPHQYSAGFKYVIVNGKITLNNGIHTGVRNGMALYNKPR
ncbi:D-aminoacylase [Panacibacter sp. DH6]|uniref:D-aminoacylase n=1 Tax=Panacibacter microcysteis TaxID=2793269 RepID=A0A931E393_9BACT|nr:D-aminoacylase [Panacibacter microcysteis]MBG9376263.1 D-aminoacylase [Panacibacter microcysteis]